MAVAERLSQPRKKFTETALKVLRTAIWLVNIVMAKRLQAFLPLSSAGSRFIKLSVGVTPSFAKRIHLAALSSP